MKNLTQDQLKQFKKKNKTSKCKFKLKKYFFILIIERIKNQIKNYLYYVFFFKTNENFNKNKNKKNKTIVIVNFF